MPVRASQPGKTAPKFLHDLFLFDPAVTSANRNVLVDSPPQFEGSRSVPLVLGKRPCKHDYVSHAVRCCLPELDERPRPNTTWRVAAVCKRCRVHLDVFVQYPSEGCGNPCPNKHRPLHHLRHASTASSGLDYNFVCSSISCQATVVVSYGPPVLSTDDLLLLTDEDARTRRYRQVLHEDPVRKDVRVASYTDVLFRLKRYVSDALNPVSTRRTFPAVNKRFMEAFGSDCDEFLARLGFGYTEEDDSWTLPQASSSSDPAQPDPHRTMLENLVIELQILIDDYCNTHATPNPSPKVLWQEGRLDLQRALSAQAYDRVPHRNLNSHEEDHPYYASLGALGDFSDDLVSFCYERQTECDPEEAPYYFDCLQDLANGRQSEVLLMKATTLASQEVFGKKDIIQAYRTLGMQPEHSSTATDQYIIGLFRSRMSDSGTAAQSELKIALKRLASIRGSQAMMDAALDRVDTYEQALAYLGTEASCADDMILALFTTKVEDDQNNEDIARRAVRIIADTRKSESLQSWLATGEVNPTAMNIDDACKHLNIQLDSVDPSMLEILFDSARMDRPGAATDQAIDAVRKAFEQQETAAAHTPDTWPVGLISHGNTCYLNSLLQYYFTIKPLRDLVLQFDKYKFDLKTHGSKTERVGNLHRPDFEIESFQQLTDDLRKLFERMIRDRGPAVKPETDLVCRAFLKPDGPNANATGTQDPDAVDTDMTSGENGNTQGTEANEPTTVRDSPNRSRASSVTLQGSVCGGDNSVAKSALLPPSPPASPQTKPEGSWSAPPLPPRRPATPQKPKTNLEKAEEAARQQQDVAEVMEELLIRLRASIKSLGHDTQGEQLDQLREIFNTRIEDTILTKGEAAVTKEADFTNVMLLPPYEPTDIYSALDRILDLHAEPYASKPIELYKTVKTFPPVLQISINRILMGREGKPIKSEHRIKLEETLYMDRYSDDATVLARRLQCFEWRKRLRQLQVEKEVISKTERELDLDGPTAIDKVSEYVSSLPKINEDLAAAGLEPVEFSEELSIDLSQEAGLQRARLSVIEKEAAEVQEKISGQFEGFEKLKYRLHAVFFHRGSTGHGHYWTYINDFRNNMWRSYNDEKVEEFSKMEDILNAHTWQQGTPTYAVYVRDDVKEQYVEPLCRDVEEVADHPMTDANDDSWPGSSQTVQGDDAVEKPTGDWDHSHHSPAAIDPAQHERQVPRISLVKGSTSQSKQNNKTKTPRGTRRSVTEVGLLKSRKTYSRKATSRNRR